MVAPELSLERVGLDYPGSDRKAPPLRVLDGVSLSIHRGEIVSVLGPSGCGKTSLLLLLAGIRKPTSGTIRFRGDEVTAPTRERTLIFQNHLLFPWKTAVENVEFALACRGVTGEAMRDRAQELLRLFHLEAFADYYPAKLSGGMQQRIGIARALAANPEVLLLDEPFASLDPFMRSLVQEELLGIIRPLGKTVVLVTHNVQEAIFLGDRVVTLSPRPGRILADQPVSFEKPPTLIEMEQLDECRDLQFDINRIIIESMKERTPTT